MQQDGVQQDCARAANEEVQGDFLNMKLKKKLAKAARKGANPFTNEPCVSSRPSVLPMKNFKEKCIGILGHSAHCCAVYSGEV